MTSRKLRRVFLLAALVVLLGANYSVKADDEDACEYCPTSTSDCAPCVAGVTCRTVCSNTFGTCSTWGAICGPS